MWRGFDDEAGSAMRAYNQATLAADTLARVASTHPLATQPAAPFRPHASCAADQPLPRRLLSLPDDEGVRVEAAP